MYISSFGKPATRCKLGVSKVSFLNALEPDKNFSSNLFIKKKIVSDINSYGISSRQKEYLKERHLQLADPDASLEGRLKIDMLLGQDISHFLSTGEKIFLPGGSILLPSWDNRYILAGPVDKDQVINKIPQGPSPPHFMVMNVNGDLPTFPFAVSLKRPRKLEKLYTKVLSSVSSEEELEIIESFRNLEALGIFPSDYEISPLLEEFDKNTSYDGKRYTVRLPFKDPQVKKLSNNFFQAFSRLMSGYKRRLKNKFKEEKVKYQESFEDDLKRGFLEKVECLGSINDIKEKLALNPQFFNQLAMANGKPCVYLPHHCVYKQSTGKFRRVNDAKSRPFKGAYSLNDCLETGPDLMTNILHILIGFRKNKWAAKADIEKAFPQVVIHPDDRDALRCLWIEGDEVWIYRFARLPFGLSCSPMILGAVLQNHLSNKGIDEQTKQNFISSLYVDDSVWSEQFLKDLHKRKQLYTEIYREAGMEFRDWTSNSSEARDIFGKLENRIPPGEEGVLGMVWDVKKDILNINSKKLKTLLEDKPLKTKRHLWKLVPSIYDPCGLLSPYVQKGKKIVSDACEKVKGWDAALPPAVIEQARKWASEFDKVGDVKWNRFTGIENAKHVQLIGACDASTEALGACIYVLNTAHDGLKTCNLLVSKTRIAPKPKHSVPRLELSSCVLLINLMKTVRKVYTEISDDDCFYFTDSADVVFWLYSGHLSWRPFVANQVKKIRKATRVDNWLHIDTTENPADLPSRGTKLSELKNNQFWMHGPAFWCKDFNLGKSKLKGYDKHYKNLTMSKTCKAEMKTSLKEELELDTISLSAVSELTEQYFKNNNFHKVICMSTFSSIVSGENIVVDVPGINNIIPNIKKLKYQTYDHLMAVTDCVIKCARKFLSLIRHKPVTEDKTQEKFMLFSDEAEILWIKATQKKHFPDIFKLIENSNCQVNASSRSLLHKHGIFLDTDLGILRCTTRNDLSQSDFSTVYPILLPSSVKNKNGNFINCEFSELLVKKHHSLQGHEGVPNTLASIRSEYWILQGRNFVQKILRKCFICRKIKGPFYSVPPSPSLPSFRVMRSRPWTGTGLDYFGPFWTKDEVGPKYKSWFIMYTCGTTRAVHFEVVRNRSTQQFIDANSRFMDSHGVPKSFVSDHEGAFKKGSKFYEKIAKNKKVQKKLKSKRISWNFYTEKSPNKGGFIERLNGTAKKCLYKVLGRKIPTFDTLRTLAVHAASVMNDRPLTFLYSSLSSEYEALTPSKLIRGYNLGESPHLNFQKKSEEEENLEETYIGREKLKNAFWNLWYQSYIKDLYERHVRQKKHQKLQVVPKLGEIVLIFGGERVPRRSWRLGRIVEIDVAKRGIVRQCTVQTLSESGAVLTKLRRPPQQLVPLEVESSVEKVDVSSIISMEGDPRSPINKSKFNFLEKNKYSKEQLAHFKKQKIWPPYRISKEFRDTSSINVGPESEFVSGEKTKISEEGYGATRNYSGKNAVLCTNVKKIKKVTFDEGRIFYRYA